MPVVIKIEPPYARNSCFFLLQNFITYTIDCNDDEENKLCMREQGDPQGIRMKKIQFKNRNDLYNAFNYLMILLKNNQDIIVDMSKLVENTDNYVNIDKKIR
jgi:hypothetical protein